MEEMKMRIKGPVHGAYIQKCLKKNDSFKPLTQITRVYIFDHETPLEAKLYASHNR